MIYTKAMALSDGHKLKDLWGTPREVFDPLNLEFNFNLDPCCTAETAKCANYFTPQEDGLTQSWACHTVFVNPPYSRGNIDKWVTKCYQESKKLGTTVVVLLPVSTSSRWFHQRVLGAAEIRFFEGRIKFDGAPDHAPFSSMLAIYGNGARGNVSRVDVRKLFKKQYEKEDS